LPQIRPCFILLLGLEHPEAHAKSGSSFPPVECNQLFYTINNCITRVPLPSFTATTQPKWHDFSQTIKIYVSLYDGENMAKKQTEDTLHI
jgi:hypothetical protein